MTNVPANPSVNILFVKVAMVWALVKRQGASSSQGLECLCHACSSAKSFT